MTVKACMDGMNTGLMLEIALQLLERRRVRLESIDIVEPSMHAVDERAYCVAIIGATINIGFVAGKLEKSLGGIEVVLTEDLL